MLVGGIEYRTQRDDAEAKAARDFAVFFNGWPGCDRNVTTQEDLGRVIDRFAVRWMLAFDGPMLVGVLGAVVHPYPGAHMLAVTACLAPTHGRDDIYRNLNALIEHVVSFPGCCDNKVAAIMPPTAALPSGLLMRDVIEDLFGPLVLEPVGDERLVRFVGTARGARDLA